MLGVLLIAALLPLQVTFLSAVVLLESIALLWGRELVSGAFPKIQMHSSL